MAKVQLRGKVIAFGGYRISRDTNSISFDSERAELDATTYESLATEIVKGLEMTAISLDGYMGGTGASPTQTAEQQIAQELAEGTGRVLQMHIGDGTLGSAALFQQAHAMGVTLGGPQGDLAPFSATMRAIDYFYFGTVMFRDITGDGLNATADSTELELGALAANFERVFAINTFDTAGTSPTLDIDVESDVSDTGGGGFVGAETTRASSTQITGNGGQIVRVTGPVTDTWWRLELTVGGTSPEFPVIVSVADRIINPQV